MTRESGAGKTGGAVCSAAQKASPFLLCAATGGAVAAPWPGRLPSQWTGRAVRLAVGGPAVGAAVLKHNLAVPSLGDMPEDSRSGGLERSQLGVAVPVPGLPRVLARVTFLPSCSFW